MPWAREAPSEEVNVEFVRRTVEEWESGVGFGYWLSEDRVRRGYATASARALTSAAFGLPGILRVEIHCDAGNSASAAIPERLGYRLARVEPVAPRAPSESGRQLVWVVDVASWVAGAP